MNADQEAGGSGQITLIAPPLKIKTRGGKMKKTFSFILMLLTVLAFTMPGTAGINDRFSPIELMDIQGATKGQDIVTLTYPQTLTNKTLTSPVITGTTWTSTVLTTPQINNIAGTFQYVFAVSALAADRTVTLPLLAGNDTFVFNNFAATLTNKTLATPAITTAITPAAAGGSTIGTAALEWGHVYLTDSAVIYAQAAQGNTLTSSASGWTANLKFSAPTLDATAADSLVLGTGSAAAGSVIFHNATNANHFTIVSGVSGASISWTLPTAVAGGANYLVNSSTVGVLGYTDPDTFSVKAGSSSIVTVGALSGGSLAAGFTPVTVPLGGTGAATYALNGVLYGNGTSAIGVTAIGAAGQILTVGAVPFVPAWSTSTFASTYVIGSVLHAATANTIAALAPGAIGSFLMSNGNAAALSYLPAGTANYVLVGAGVTTIPVWTASTGTGAPVLGTSPTLVTPALGTPASGVLTSCTGLPTAGLVDAAVTSAKLDEGTIRFAEVSLSNAQILALTTPVQVVAAPGAGKVISFVDAIVIHDVGTADFATAHNITINYKADGTGATVSTTSANAFISGAVSDKISTLKQLTTDITTATKADYENQPLTIKASANPITGNGVGRVKVWYRVFSTGL